jgi:hypothetical protein
LSDASVSDYLSKPLDHRDFICVQAHRSVTTSARSLNLRVRSYHAHCVSADDRSGIRRADSLLRVVSTLRSRLRLLYRIIRQEIALFDSDYHLLEATGSTGSDSPGDFANNWDTFVEDPIVETLLVIQRRIHDLVRDLNEDYY